MKSNSIKLQEIDRKFKLISFYDLPGMIILGLAFYAKYSKSEQLFLPVLENENVIRIMFIIGVLNVLIFSSYAVYLTMQRKKLIDEQNT